VLRAAAFVQQAEIEKTFPAPRIELPERDVDNWHQLV
jgi:hypothetical protein